MVIATHHLVEFTDRALEASVVGSFSRAGYAVRSRMEYWPDPPNQRGRVHLVTGASSGIGKAAALRLGGLGSQVWVIGRDPVRTEASAEAVRAMGGRAEAACVDVTDLDAVANLCARLVAQNNRLDGLVHAAGALTTDYRTVGDGTEMTVATAVVAPYRLTVMLAPLLRAGRANVVTLSSGGMYTERFDLDRLVSSPDDYDGVRAYARAKRAQVVLSHELARQLGPAGTASYACHPGWVDTPGLVAGLPNVARLRPLLRTPGQGADTAVWLAAGGARGGHASRPAVTEGFFHDRRLRSEHRLSRTQPADCRQDGAQLWAWCEEKSGISLP